MRLPIAALVMIMVAGLCFFLYVGFNQAFHGEGMLKETLWDSANETLTGSRKTQFDSWMPKLTQGFGIASVMCILIAVAFFVIEAFHKPPETGRY